MEEDKKQFIFEKKSKYLELIQEIISRMADCSFKCKEYCILLISAIIAVYSSIDSHPAYLILFCALPSLLFWILDSFYLCKEKQYRDLYFENQNVEDDVVEFDLKTKKSAKAFLKSMFLSISTTPLYFALIICSIVIGSILLLCGGCC